MSPDTPLPDPETARAQRLLSEGLAEDGATEAGPLQTVEEIAARFPEIVEAIGQGGMGVVYKARQPHLDRFVALKVLRRGLGDDPAFPERFSREARALARLDHPHIVKVFDFGEREGLYFLLIEHVDGASLRDLIEAGRLAPTEALAIVPQICDALQYAHDKGIVHRDIKPENVLMDERGRVKIADFGLAKLVGQEQRPPTLTGTRQVMGTWQYMAPEQYRTPQDVDHRADIFSLGVVFYEMLTGELPVGRFQQPSEAQDLDARIDAVVMRALEGQREDRYQRVDEVKDDVEGIRDPEHAPRVRSEPGAGRGRSSGREGAWWLVPALLMPFVTWGGAFATQQFILTIRSYRTANLWMAIVGAGVALVGMALAVVALRRGVGRVRTAAIVAVAINLLSIPLVWVLAAQSTYRSEHQWMGFDRPPQPREATVRPRLLELTGGGTLPTVEGGLDATVDARAFEEVLELWQAWTRRGDAARLARADAHRFYTAESAAELESLAEDAFVAGIEAKRLGVGFATEAEMGVPPHGLRVHHIRLSRRRTSLVNDRGVVDARSGLGSENVIVRFPIARDDAESPWRFATGPLYIIRK